MRSQSLPDTKKPGRGRPRSFDIDVAVGAAQMLFQQHGYAGVSTAMVCDRLGIAPPSLYAAFGSKAQLFDLVIERYLTTEGAFMADALGQPDLALLVRRLLGGAAVSYATPEGSGGCLIMHGVRSCGDPAADAIISRVRADLFRQIATAVARHDQDRADEIASLLNIGLGALAVAALDGVNRPKLDRFARVLSEGILAA